MASLAQQRRAKRMRPIKIAGLADLEESGFALS